MKISVIIPTYNEAQHIKSCTTSLLNQSQPLHEIIIVDDGSTDSTLKVLLSLKNENKKLKIYRQKHLGPGSSRNFGVKKSAGDILVFVDADMEFDKDFLKHLTKPIKEHQSKGTFSKLEYVKNWSNPWAKAWNQRR